LSRLSRSFDGTAANRENTCEAFAGPVTSICMEARIYPIGGIWKRLFDFFIALTTLATMAPLMLVIALLILVLMGRPILSARQTIGFNGSEFPIFRFRTSVCDPNVVAGIAARPGYAVAPGEAWLGKVLQDSELAALPTLFNILRGDMSVVGPIPMGAAEFARFSSHAQHYVQARPGLVSLQIALLGNTLCPSRTACDYYYVRRWSPGLDAFIVMQTVLGPYVAGRGV
jgi:exopolysaccharide production protein ExoY